MLHGEDKHFGRPASMACTAQSMISANSCCSFAASHRILKKPQRSRGASRLFFSANASSTGAEESDCNAEECAPDKEVNLHLILGLQTLLLLHQNSLTLSNVSSDFTRDFAFLLPYEAYFPQFYRSERSAWSG